jgi:hypothetical protein
MGRDEQGRQGTALLLAALHDFLEDRVYDA